MNVNAQALLSRLPVISHIIGLRARRRERMLEQVRQEQRILTQREDAETIRRVSRFPIRDMTRAELAALPPASEIDPHTVPLGTWYASASCPLLPDVILVGQVVAGMEMIAEQWGAGIAVPERGINRYRVRLVD